MKQRELENDFIDQMLRQAKIMDRPDADLLAKIEAQALLVQTENLSSPVKRDPNSARFGREVLGLLGGWRGFGGVLTAGILGVAIGFSDISMTGNLIEAAFGDQFVWLDGASDLDQLFLEG